jgi:hypothetical protein
MKNKTWDIPEILKPELLNLEKQLNISDDRSSKIIYTVVPYFSNGYEVNQNDVKSFTDFKKAEEYTWTLNCHFDVIENELI